ncbi:hypothetical protein [Nonomuraea pusilla]
MATGLLTDLYELNMAAAYLRRGMTRPATLSLFVREPPPGRGFLVTAGLEDCLRLPEDFRFDPSDLDPLRRGQGRRPAACSRPAAPGWWTSRSAARRGSRPGWRSPLRAGHGHRRIGAGRRTGRGRAAGWARDVGWAGGTAGRRCGRAPGARGRRPDAGVRPRWP